MVHEHVTAQWRVRGESVPGAAHASDGLPKQGAISWTPPSGEGTRVILAISGGHGSATHFRSALGAALAVRVATTEMQHLLQSPYDSASLLALRPVLERRLPRRLVRAWQTVVAAHVAERPFTEAEWARLVAQEGAPARQRVEAHPALAYAATLVSVVVRDSDILYVQLGAGDIVTVAATGEVSRPWGTDARLLAHDTTSLCLPDAWQACRVHVQRVSAVDPALIVLSTAGYAHACSEEGFLQGGADLLELMRRDGFEGVQHKLAGRLAATVQHGARDTMTLGILSRIDPRPPRRIAAPPQREIPRQDVSGHRHDARPVHPDDAAAAPAAGSALTSSSLAHEAPPPPATSRRQQTAVPTRRRRLQERHARVQQACLMLGGMCAVTVLTLALVLWRHRPEPPPLDHPQLTLREPTHVEPDEPQREPTQGEPDEPPRPPRLWRLTVLPTPADSTVQITNIRPKYMPGMALAPGTYTIRVTREGFVPQERAITMRTADVTERIALQPLPPPPRTFGLTVLPTPADSRITVTDARHVAQPYVPGMALAPGTYTIRVTRDQHVAVEQTITISNADVVVPMTLMRIPTPPAPRLEPVAPPQELPQTPREAERARLEQEYNRLRQAQEQLAQRIARHNEAGRRLNEQGQGYILPEEVRRHNALVDRHQAESGRLLQEQRTLSQQLDDSYRALQRAQFSAPGRPEATQSLTESDGRPRQQEDGGRERR
jgi:Protein phosphatase 2C